MLVMHYWLVGGFIKLSQMYNIKKKKKLNFPLTDYSTFMLQDDCQGSNLSLFCPYCAVSVRCKCSMAMALVCCVLMCVGKKEKSRYIAFLLTQMDQTILNFFSLSMSKGGTFFNNILSVSVCRSVIHKNVSR